MHQLMVSSAPAEVSRMSMSSGANKWASRAVVVLQLAAWSAVGIILLQKGVTSLQKTPEVRNATQRLSAVSQAAKDGTEMGGFAVIPLLEKSINQQLQTPDQNKLSRTESILRDGELSSSDKQVDVLGNYLKEQDKLKGMERIVDSEDGKSSGKLLHLDSSNNNHSSEGNKRLKDELKSTPIDVLLVGTRRHESAWEVRRKMRMTNLSEGGAAAAVAMVAVGAVMLVLGPAVIILRALDEKRQERRFQKLSGQDDLPPTYEQATLMDQAPRYSTLSLNTILGPPPPPSPTPSRLETV